MWVIVSVELHCFNWRASELLYKMTCIDSIEERVSYWSNWKANYERLIVSNENSLKSIFSARGRAPSIGLLCHSVVIQLMCLYQLHPIDCLCWARLRTPWDSFSVANNITQWYRQSIPVSTINCTRLIVSLGTPLEIHFQIAQCAPRCQCRQYYQLITSERIFVWKIPQKRICVWKIPQKWHFSF